MSAFDGPWWVAGGYALDLFAGHERRPHGDLDVEVLRIDAHKLHRALPDWEHHLAHDGVLSPWSPEAPLPAEVNSVWSRPGAAGAWAVEFLFAHTIGGEWVYRRHPAVRRPLRTVGLLSPDGIPFLSPEIQLLYKAKESRSKDEADFAGIFPLLTPAQRRWLAQALDAAHPGHPWGRVLG